MGYCVQYIVTFRDNGYLEKNNYGDVCQFIRDTCQFNPRDIGNPLHIQASFMAQLNCILNQLLEIDLYSMATHIHSQLT